MFYTYVQDPGELRFPDAGQQDAGREGAADEVAGVGQSAALTHTQGQPVVGRLQCLHHILE